MAHFSSYNISRQEQPPTCSDGCILQDDSLVDESDVLRGLGCSQSLSAQRMEDPCGRYCMLAVLNKLAEMSQTSFLGLGVLLDDADQCINNSTLVIKATLQHK